MSGSWVMAGENKGKYGGDALGVVEGGERTVLGKPKERTTVGLQTQRQVIWVSQPPTKALEEPCHTSHRSATLMPSQSLMHDGPWDEPAARTSLLSTSNCSDQSLAGKHTGHKS